MTKKELDLIEEALNYIEKRGFIEVNEWKNTVDFIYGLLTELEQKREARKKK
jgi:hypothetical protein